MNCPICHSPLQYILKMYWCNNCFHALSKLNKTQKPFYSKCCVNTLSDCLFIGSSYTKSQLQIKCDHIRSLRPTNKKYMNVIATRVLENSVDPIKTLQQLQHYLEDNGLLYILCNNINNVANFKFPSNQLNNFSTNSLNQLCNRAGLKLIDIVNNEIIIVSNNQHKKSNIPERLYNEILKDVYSENHIVKYAHFILSQRALFHILCAIKKLNFIHESKQVP